MKKLSLENIIKNKDTRVLEIPTPTNKSYPEKAINFIIENFRSRIGDASLVDDIRVAAGEMIANAVDYGNKRNSSKKIRVYCSWFGNNFYFVVQDEGKGFDINNPEYRGFPPPEGGMGIEVTRMKMDLVYNFRDAASYVCKGVRASN